MAQYSVGISTQAKILDSCRTLFYQKGVLNTSYGEICAAADINRGLIPYYFKSKNNIATIIFREFIEEADRLILEICGEDENLRFITTNALYYDLEKRDPNFCRFYDEIEYSAFWSELTLEMQYRVINKMIDHNSLQLSDDARRTVACMCEGVEKELVHGIASGFLLEDAWSIAERDSMFFLGVLGIDKAVIQRYLEQSKTIYNTYCLYCAPDFSVSLRRR